MMATSSVFDATSLYRSVLNRRARRATVNGQRNAAIAMAEALSRFLQRPTASGLREFEQAEHKWLGLVERHNISYAAVLKKQMSLGATITCSVTGINSPHNSAYDPAYGYVYGFTSTAHPYKIKLGATTGKRHPEDRRAEFVKKYGLQDVQIAFFCEVSYPARAEELWTNRFRDRRAKLGNHESREWYDFNPSHALEEVQKVVRDLGLREFGKWYASKSIRLKLDQHFPTPSERQVLPGCIAGSQV